MNEQSAALNEPLAARLALGLSQVEVAFRAKLSLSTIIRAENSGQWPHNPNNAKAHKRVLKVKTP